MLLARNIQCQTPPSRVRGLYVRNLWGELAQNPEFVIYFSPTAIRTFPNRRYFFGILSTIYPDQYQEFLNATQQQRLQTQTLQNRTVLIDPEINQILQELQDLSLLSKGKKTKRIVMRTPQRRNRN